MDLGKNIKKARTKKEFSQSKLADLVGCKRANIANIEAGRIYPSLQLLIKLKAILGINLNKIEGEKNENNSVSTN